jgi:hypothetical protein
MGSAALPIAAGVLSGLGGLFGANKQDKLTKEQIEEQKRQFNLGSLPGVARQSETSGLRDKLLAIFGQMAGQPWQQFTALAGGNPADPFSPGQGSPLMSDPHVSPALKPANPNAGMGHAGMDPSAMSLSPNYKMGDGGVNPDVYTWLMGQLGYQTPEERAKQQQPTGRPPLQPNNQPTIGPTRQWGPAGAPFAAPPWLSRPQGTQPTMPTMPGQRPTGMPPVNVPRTF